MWEHVWSTGGGGGGSVGESNYRYERMCLDLLNVYPNNGFFQVAIILLSSFFYFNDQPYLQIQLAKLLFSAGAKSWQNQQ